MNKKYIPNNEIDIFHIGDIDLSISIAEQAVGMFNISPFGECKVDIYGKEGPIPHFHITHEDKKKKKSLSCCIKIFEPEYFVHGTHKGVLSNEQIKILDSWLQSPHRLDISRCNWEVIRDLWIIISSYMTPELYREYKQRKQPNYLLMIK